MFFHNKYVILITKKTAGLHHTEIRAGDAPKLPLSMESIENPENPKINIPSTIKIIP